MVNNSRFTKLHESSRLEVKSGRRYLTFSLDSSNFILKFDRVLHLIRQYS